MEGWGRVGEFRFLLKEHSNLSLRSQGKHYFHSRIWLLDQRLRWMHFCWLKCFCPPVKYDWSAEILLCKLLDTYTKSSVFVKLLLRQWNPWVRICPDHHKDRTTGGIEVLQSAAILSNEDHLFRILRSVWEVGRYRFSSSCLWLYSVVDWSNLRMTMSDQAGISQPKCRRASGLDLRELVERWWETNGNFWDIRNDCPSGVDIDSN